jgi:hypothetical protein
MASVPLVQVPLLGARASPFDSNKIEFVKTPSPSPESSPEKEAAKISELDLAALIISGRKKGSPGFTCRMVAEGGKPCIKSQETGQKCARRLERVDQEMIDCFMTLQPAPPVLPRISCRPNLDQIELDAIRTVQDLRDFEWDILTQFSTQGYALAWLCDCGNEKEEEVV